MSIMMKMTSTWWEDTRSFQPSCKLFTHSSGAYIGPVRSGDKPRGDAPLVVDVADGRASANMLVANMHSDGGESRNTR